MEGSNALLKRGITAGTDAEGTSKMSQALLVARMRRQEKPDASGDTASSGRGGIAQNHGLQKQPEQHGHSHGRGHGR